MLPDQCEFCDGTASGNPPPLAALLEQYEITDYEIGGPCGYSLVSGPLTKLIIYNRNILDAGDFVKIGYGVVCREKEAHEGAKNRH